MEPFTSSNCLPRACPPSTSPQLVTYLLFLEIDDERSRRPLNPVQVVPDGLGWQSLVNKDGSVLEDQFRHVLQECGKLDLRPQP